MYCLTCDFFRPDMDNKKGFGYCHNNSFSDNTEITDYTCYGFSEDILVSEKFGCIFYYNEKEGI